MLKADKAAVNPTVETKPTVAEVAETFSLSSVLPLVLEKFGVPKGLEDLLQQFVGGEAKFDLRRVFKRQLQTRITAQEGRSGAELLARSLVKQIDRHYETEVQGLTMEDRHAVVSALAANVARQFVLAADIIGRYPEVARDVNIAKQANKVRELAVARTNRTVLVEEFKQTLVNAVRAIVGDENIG